MTLRRQRARRKGGIIVVRGWWLVTNRGGGNVGLGPVVCSPATSHQPLRPPSHPEAFCHSPGSDAPGARGTLGVAARLTVTDIVRDKPLLVG